MEVNKVYQGDCMELIKRLQSNSVDSVITSPPYWQLRDYKWDGQWGLEPTFELYLKNLFLLMDEVWRVLKDDGTVWINLGDTYNGNKKGNDDPKLNDDITSVTSKVKKVKQSIPNKSLCLIPHRFAIGCVDNGWVLRNDIIWAKRNGMPESVTDRFSKKHEYLFLMAKQEDYYFDLDAIRGKHIWASRDKRSLVQGGVNHKTGLSILEESQYSSKRVCYNKNGKNPGDVSDFWDIPTKSSGDSHFAQYNKKLISKPILSGCPFGGIILDPFCGTATTGCCAIELGRKFIGFEGRKEYVELANKKLMPHLSQKNMFYEDN